MEFLKSIFFVFFIFHSILIINGCKVAEKLSINKVDNNTSILELNGYYYTKYETGYSVFLLYRNGSYFDIGAFLNVSSLDDLDQVILTKDFTLYNSLYYCWGV